VAVAGKETAVSVAVDPWDRGSVHRALREAVVAFGGVGVTLDASLVRTGSAKRSTLFLAGPGAPCTTGHIPPVDGGLAEAFLR